MQSLLKSKIIQFCAVLFLAACILLTGTYAWADFMNKDTRNILPVEPEGITLVDFSDQMGEIYAINNTGDTLLLRIKLLQYLEKGGSSVVRGALKDDPSTWAIAGTEEIEPYFRLILSKAVISMEEWKTRGAPQGDYWVMDTDGWFYYAVRLAPGQSTRTLLQEIIRNEFTELVEGEYCTTTVLQAVTREDLSGLLAMDKGSYTDDGRRLMRYVCGEMIEFVDGEIT